MSDNLLSEMVWPFVHPTTETIETEDVLVILRALEKRASSPVARTCLREVRAEIAFLMSSEGTFEDYFARDREDWEPDDIS